MLDVLVLITAVHHCNKYLRWLGSAQVRYYPGSRNIPEARGGVLLLKAREELVVGRLALEALRIVQEGEQAALAVYQLEARLRNPRNSITEMPIPIVCSGR